jgi:hypothetical protein
LASPVGSRVFGAPKPWDIVEDGLLMKWGVHYPYIIIITKIRIIVIIIVIIIMKIIIMD